MFETEHFDLILSGGNTLTGPIPSELGNLQQMQAIALGKIIVRL